MHQGDIDGTKLVGNWYASAPTMEHIKKQEKLRDLFRDATPYVILRQDRSFTAKDFPIKGRQGSFTLIDEGGTWEVLDSAQGAKLFLRFEQNRGVVLGLGKQKGTRIIYVSLGDPDLGNRIEFVLQSSQS